MTPGLVSIVVASYNHAEYLVERMQSLLAQTYVEIEILVIDDCSPDNSVEILRNFATDPRVSLIVRGGNGGWVAVSNQGAELASGEYLLYANCDDACEPEMVSKLVKAMQKNPSAGVSFCRSLLVDASGKVLGDDYAGREPAFKARCAGDTLISGREMSRFLLHSCVMPNLSAVLMRKSDFLAAGGFSGQYKANSDWELFFRLAERCDVAYVAAPLNHFRQHETTVRSQTKSQTTYEEFFRLLLGEIRRLDLGFLERCKYRMRVMALWGHHLLTQPIHGLRNFPYHLGRVLALDPPAVLFFPLAVVEHALSKVAGVLGRAFRSPDR